MTTIPAAANVGLSAAYEDWDSFEGSLGQLGTNLAGIIVAGTVTLLIQRLLFRRRRLAHLRDPARELAGLPVAGRGARRRYRASRSGAAPSGASS